LSFTTGPDEAADEVRRLFALWQPVGFRILFEDAA
jgi:hypothetical protein